MYQVALFIPADKIDEARTLVSATFGVPESEAHYAYSVPFTSDGLSISLYGGAFYITEDQLIIARTHLQPWAKFFRWDVDTGELLATSEDAELGSQWSAVQSVQHLNLRQWEG